MFGRARRESAGTALVPIAERKPQRPRANRGPSIVAIDLHIKGDVATEGELHIDGRVDGDVEALSLTIGVDGHVVGHIEAQEITVQGIVNGTMRGRRIRLMRNCKVIADISHDILSIDEGASFEGQCRRIQADEVATPGRALRPVDGRG